MPLVLSQDPNLACTPTPFFSGDRNRHRARKAKFPSTFGHASRADTATLIAGAVITLANKPG